VLGKAAVTLSSVYLLYTSPWLEIADAYLVSSMSGSDECKRFPKWCPTSRACTHIFWTRLLLSGRDSRTLGQELGVKCIISTSMFNRQPKEYLESRFPLEHAQVGGVTNFVGQILVFKRSQNAPNQSDLVLNDASTLPRRDLRFVLKSGSPGRWRVKPSPMPRGAVSRMMYIRANLISSCDLFPASGGKGLVIPRVHTELGGDWWVEREVSASELLAMWDVPEPLVMTPSSDKERRSLLKSRRSLLKSCKVPLKVMEHVVDSLHSMWSRDAETPVRKRSVNPATRAAAPSVTPIEIERCQLVPIDEDTHPELSKESTNNPEVSLAE